MREASDEEMTSEAPAPVLAETAAKDLPGN